MRPLPRRPLAGLAIVFMMGTGLGLAFPASQGVLLSLSAATLGIAVIGSFSRMGNNLAGLLVTHSCILATTLVLGWANATGSSGARGTDIQDLIPLPCGVRITGIIEDEPVCVSRRGERSTWKFPIRIEQIQTGGRSHKLTHAGIVRARLYMTPSDRIPAYGERWSIGGYMAQMTIKKGLFAGKPGSLFFSASGSKARLIDSGAGNPIIAKCLQLRTQAGTVLAYGITDRPDQARILNSILLGYYSQIPRDLYQAFANTGTLHVFAISGSHVVILGGTIIFILAASGLPRTRWILFMAPLLTLYTAMTGLQPSAVRACIMGVVYWLAPMIGRKPDIFTSLAVSAILILAVAPDDLVNIGFILSYVAVLGLILFCPVILAPLQRCFQHDPLKLERDPHWQEMLRTLWVMFSELFAVSLAAWLVTAPLTILFFGTFSPIGLPSNLLVVPLSSLVIITGVLSLTLGSCALWLADLFNHSNLALIILMTESARWFSKIPHGCLQVDAPPLWSILLFYTLLLSGRFTWWIYGDGGNAVTKIEDEG